MYEKNHYNLNKNSFIVTIFDKFKKKVIKYLGEN